MKARIFIVSFLAVVLFCFVFSTLIAEVITVNCTWEDFEEFPMDEDSITVHGGTTDDLKWTVNSTMGYSGTGWQIGVELRISQDGQQNILVQEIALRDETIEGAVELSDVEYNVADLYHYLVQLWPHFQGHEPDQGAAYGVVVYPYNP